VGVSVLPPILEKRKQYGGGCVNSSKYTGGEKEVWKWVFIFYLLFWGQRGSMKVDVLILLIIW
jgi:hypothetical protein